MVKIINVNIGQWRKLNKIGRHLKEPSRYEIEQAVEECETDGFDTLYVYTDKNRVSAGCRWCPRLGIYKGAHFTFDPDTLEARSYGWFPMLRKIGARLVLNQCHYSNQTAKDYGRLAACLRREGLKVDCSIYAPNGLHNLNDAKTYYINRIYALIQLTIKPGTHKRKNAERKAEIRKLRFKLKLVVQLMRVEKAAETRQLKLVKYA